MPDADGEAAAGGVRGAVPVHVAACFLHDPGDLAEVGASLGEVVEGEIAGCADEGGGFGGFEEIEDFGVGEVVGEEDWS